MDSIEEFSKKYMSTWVQYVTDKKQKIPVFMENIDGIERLLYIASSEVGSLTVRYTEQELETRLDLNPPQTGFFNYKSHALVLFKTPARQWRRGFCSDNHEIYNPFKKILNEGAYRPSFTAGTVDAVYKPRYITDPAEARDHVSRDKHSVALSKHLMVSKSPLEDSNYPLIWFDTNPVGFIRGNKIVVEDEVFQQEVEDELRRLGLVQWIF